MKKIKVSKTTSFTIIGGILLVLVAGLVLMGQEGCVKEFVSPPSQLSQKELKLSDFPEVFKEDTLIVVGDNASEIELEATEDITSFLEEKTDTKPPTKKYSELTDEDKKNYNLIIVGTPETNLLLNEIYKVSGATQVTEKFPGKNKGVLEILRNVWNENRAMVLIHARDKIGVKNASKLTTKIPVNPTRSLVKNAKNFDVWTDKAQYLQGEPVKIYFWNGLDYKVYLYFHVFNVERFENNKWRKYSTASPYERGEPPRLFISPNNGPNSTWPRRGEYTIWNQYYYGIDEDNFNKQYKNRRGKYRVSFELWNSSGELVDKVYSNEFRINE